MEVRESQTKLRMLTTEDSENNDEWLYTIKDIFDIYVESELYEDGSVEIQVNDYWLTRFEQQVIDI